MTSNTGGIIPWDSICNISDLLSGAASNCLTSRLKIIYENFTRENKLFCSERSVIFSGPCDKVMNNVCQWGTVRLKLANNKHYNIRPTVHCIRNIICNWIGDVWDRYILFSRSRLSLLNRFNGYLHRNSPIKLMKSPASFVRICWHLIFMMMYVILVSTMWTDQTWTTATRLRKHINTFVARKVVSR